MTDTKPEALRLAELLDGDKSAHHEEAAAELRRLHDEVRYNSALERVLDKQSAKILRLHEVNAELLEALKQVMTWIDNWDAEFTYDPDWPTDEDKARAAIAKAE